MKSRMGKDTNFSGVSTLCARCDLCLEACFDVLAKLKILSGCSVAQPPITTLEFSFLVAGINPGVFMDSMDPPATRICLDAENSGSGGSNFATCSWLISNSFEEEDGCKSSPDFQFGSNKENGSC